MKQRKAYEMSMKQLQNEVRLNAKPTPKKKKNIAWEKHSRGVHLHQKKTS